MVSKMLNNEVETCKVYKLYIIKKLLICKIFIFKTHNGIPLGLNYLK